MMLGMAATGGGDYRTAIEAWDALIALHPDGDGADTLKGARAKARERLANQSYVDNLRVTVEAASHVPAGGTLFVFLRKPGDTGQPLAAVRTLADRFPLTVEVKAGNWLQAVPPPGTELVAGARYASGPGGDVASAAIVTKNQPVTGKAGALRATVELK